MGREAPMGSLVAWEEERGTLATSCVRAHRGWVEPAKKGESAEQQVVPITYVSDDISVPLPLLREKQRASKAKYIYLICHASKTQADGEDEMPDLCLLSEDKHMTALRRDAHFSCSHAFPWEWGNCFVFFFLIFLLLLLLFPKYPASWRLGLKR